MGKILFAVLGPQTPPKAGLIRTFNPGLGRLQSISGGGGITNSILATPTPAGTLFRKSPPPSLLGTLSPSPLPPDGDEQAGSEFAGPEGQQEQQGGAGGAAGGRRRKQCLSARERNVRRIESNERERLRMHGLNEAFQVSAMNERVNDASC